MDNVKSANVGEFVEIAHKIYSHIEFSQDSDGFTFGCRIRRSGRMNYPSAPRGEVKYWRTLKGAKKYALTTFLATK